MEKLQKSRRNYVMRLYEMSTDHSLADCYGNYSSAKAKAFDYCLGLMNKVNGRGMKVLSYNTFHFTVGFTFEEDGVEKMAYITPSHDYAFEIEKEEG